MSTTADPLWQLSATELARAIRSGQVSSREVIRAHLQRMETVNPAVNAVTVVLSDRALAQGRAADRALAAGEDLPALHGVVRGWVELAHAHQPDATFVRQLFESGDPGKRIGALAIMTEVPTLADHSIVAAALREPASAFEQYHALRAAETLVIHRSTEPATRELVELVGKELAAGHVGAERSDRRNLAERILAMLTGEAP